MFWGPILLVISFYMFALNPSVLGYVISALIICLMLWVWFGTEYKIKEGHIKIKSDPFRSTVNIDDVKKLSASNISLSAISYISGPALATDRLEILYGNKYDVVNISPKNEKDFLNTLISKNPDIQIDKSISW